MEWGREAAERRASATKIGLSAERQIGCSRSAHMLWFELDLAINFDTVTYAAMGRACFYSGQLRPILKDS